MQGLTLLAVFCLVTVGTASGSLQSELRTAVSRDASLATRVQGILSEHAALHHSHALRLINDVSRNAGVVPGIERTDTLADIDADKISSIEDADHTSSLVELFHHIHVSEHLKQFNTELFPQLEAGEELSEADKQMFIELAARAEASKCDSCKSARPSDWKKVCASQCGRSDVKKETFMDKITNSAHFKVPECPKLRLTFGCFAAFLPHISIIGGQGSFNALTGGVELVSDYKTFEIALFAYGGLQIGTNFAELGSLGIYAGFGFKGSTLSAPIRDAYSAYFLSISVGGSVFAGIAATFSASANPIVNNVGGSGVHSVLVTKPDFNAVLTLNLGVGLAAEIPTGPDVNVLTTYYLHLFTFKCGGPACYAACLALIPSPGANVIQKIISMQLFMKNHCGKSSNRNSAVCRVYLAGQRIVMQTIEYWAKEGLVGGVLKPLSYANEAIKAALSTATRKALAATNKWLSKHVGSTTDSVRAALGDVSPETRVSPSIPIPSGRGLYMKLDWCDHISGIDEPYFVCKADELSGKVTTQVGVKHGSKHRWSYQPGRSTDENGWGRKYRNRGRGCVRCVLWNRHRFGHSLRFGADEEFKQNKLTVCSSSSTDNKWREVSISGRSAKCRVFLNAQTSTQPNGVISQ